MKYFKLLYDYVNDEDAICCESDELYCADRYDVEKGVIINDWDDRITLYYNPKEGNRETDFLGNDLGWLIISEKLKLILENEMIRGIQYLPVSIKNKLDSKLLNNYYVANIYNSIDALDLSRSDYSVFELDENEKIFSFKLHVLKGEKLKGIDIFRLKEDNIPQFVSEKIVNLIKENGITGFDFNEVVVV